MYCNYNLGGTLNGGNFRLNSVHQCVDLRQRRGQ